MPVDGSRRRTIFSITVKVVNVVIVIRSGYIWRIYFFNCRQAQPSLNILPAFKEGLLNIGDFFLKGVNFFAGIQNVYITITITIIRPIIRGWNLCKWLGIFVLPVRRDSRSSGSFSRTGAKYSSRENQVSVPVMDSPSCDEISCSWMRVSGICRDFQTYILSNVVNQPDTVEKVQFWADCQDIAVRNEYV